ncbi:TlpA family protein disulfide reductase [Aestuariimicrobium ganziense]|uniref:TlpA family protein disulfide reductase n=1 Tax=Aestuariimicrobium ganziense TaxID=2773677 RepID=UPI002E299280|nr:TlpA disulfide reductase family protein [Aestuariimicrobium ganziense]
MTLARRSLLAGLGLAGLLGAAGCTRNPSATEDVGFVAGDGSFSLVPVDKRVQAPILTGPDLEGKSLTTDGRTGRVVVLNVWGSWCSPCRAEAPELVKAAAQTRGTADFLGINTRDNDVAPARAFVRAFKVDYPNFYDPRGELLLQLKALPANAIPSTLFLDPQGRIAARILGEAKASTFVGAVNDLAAGK